MNARNGIILSLFFFVIIATQLAMASDAVITYATDGSASPSINFWNSSGSGSWGPALALNSSGAGVQVVFPVIKASTVSDKLVLVTLGDNNRMAGYVCMANCTVISSWRNTTNIGNSSDYIFRGFDVEFETATGDAVLVYSISSTTASRDLAYKVLPNATTNFGGLTEQYIDDPAGNLQYTWVRLVRNPTNTSEEMILTAFDSTNNRINAWVWNGTAFTNQTPISNTATQTAGYEALAARYSADGTKGMVIGANGTAGNVSYRYWSGAAWSSVSAFDMNSTNTNDVQWMTLKADPAGTYLQAVLTDNLNALYTAFWNGSSWNVSNRLEDNLAVSGSGNDLRAADFEWNPSGSTGVVVWDNETTATTISLHQVNCSPKCNNTITTFSTYRNETRFLTLYRNPTDNDTVNIIGIRMMRNGTPYYLNPFSYNGTGYTNNGERNITATAFQDTYESYNLAFYRSSAATPASAPNVSAVKVNQTTLQASPGGIVQFNITVTNNGNALLNVTITDALPAELTFASAYPANTSAGPSWNYTGLAAGSSLYYYVNATVNAGVVSAGTPIRNLANNVSVTAKPPTGSNVTANSSANVTVYYANVTGVKANLTAQVASQGGMVQYLITVNNTGNVSLNITVNDTLDAALQYNSSSPAGTLNVQNINWTFVLASGSTQTIYLNATVRNYPTGCQNTINYLNVTGVPPNGNSVNATTSLVVPVCLAEVSAVKANITAFVASQGGMVQYMITVNNTGNVSLNITVNDTIPGELTYDNADPAGSYSDPNVVWTFNNVAPGDYRVILLNATVDYSPTECQDTTNYLNVIGVPDNGVNVNDSDSIIVPVCLADITAIKANLTAKVASQGGTVQYLITVENTGNVSLDVTVNDTLDTSNLAYSSSSDGGSFSSPNVVWTLTLNPGDVKNIYLNATVLNYPTECEDSTNSVFVTGVPDNGNNVNDSDSITLPVCLADITAVKANITGEVASQGGTVSYFITVTNTGNVSLNITVNDTLDSAMHYTYSDPSPTTNTSQEIIWTFNNVAPGLMEQIHLNATVNNYPAECQDTTNNLNVIGVPDNGNNVTYSGSLIVPVCLADISVIKLNQTAEQPSPGGIVEFNITITNDGNVTLEPVEVIDELPVGFTFFDATPYPNDVSGQQVTWDDVEPIDPGDSDVIYLSATVSEGVVDNLTTTKVLTNEVNVTGTPPNGDDVTANDTADVTVYYAEVAVLKADITPLPISPGGTVQWLINITNPGQVPLDLFVTDMLPAGFYYDGATPAADEESVDEREMNWTTLPTLGVGGTQLIYLDSVAEAPDGTYENTVTVVGTPPNGVDVAASHTASVGINASAVSVVKTVSPTSISVGGNVTFTLTITNSGEVNLTIDAVDTLPHNVNFIEASVTPDDTTGGVIVWDNLAYLAPWENFTLTYNASANTSGTYTNDVVVTGTPDNGDDVNAGDSASFTAGTPPTPSHDDGGGAEPISVSVSSDCDGNVVTVESGGDALAGAQVKVNGDVIGNTNSKGQITFEGCGLVDATVLAKKSGYITNHVHVDTVACSQCVECANNNECPTDNSCTDGKCVPITCECGKIENHACTQYECCSNSECPQGELCGNHVCNPLFECTKNADCGATEYCFVQTGQAGGDCKEVVGGCGKVSNHAFTPYECGVEPGCPLCPSGYVCSDNQCAAYAATAPENGVVGDNATVHVTVDGQPCVECEIVITNPDGSKTNGRTDGNGDLILPLQQSGTYKVSLLDGSDLRTITVGTAPKATPLESGTEAPVTTSKPPQDQLPCILGGVFLLVLLLVLFYLWQRGKKEDKGPTHAKIKK